MRVELNPGDILRVKTETATVIISTRGNNIEIQTSAKGGKETYILIEDGDGKLQKR